MTHRLDKLRELARAVPRTLDREIDCDQWLDRVGGYLDALAAGAEVTPEMAEIIQHAEVCPDCRQELNAMFNTLDARESKPDPDRDADT